MRDGDLWEHTQKMVAAKGAKSVRVQKVKGHATEDMVAAGQVRERNKRGNDNADQAAGKGARDEQSGLHSLTQMYAERHAAYRKLMARIHKFLVEMMKAEKRPGTTWKKKSIPSCKKQAEGRQRKNRAL